MSTNFSKFKDNLINKLKQRFRIIIQTEHDFQEKKNFNITPFKLISISVFLILFFIVLTTVLISFTRLRVLIPGYSDPLLREQLYDLELRTDSLDLELNRLILYNSGIRKILLGEDSLEIIQNDEQILNTNFDFEYKISPIDSAFRSEFEQESMYNLHESLASTKDAGIKSFGFYPPIKGIITSKFDLKERHIGTDIIPVGSELVKSIMNGVVVFSGWTVETGNVIIISHLYNIISIYKHNAVLMSRTGDYVRAGEVIAVCGNSGELTTGPHLHFELWIENMPINPEEFIDFGEND